MGSTGEVLEVKASPCSGTLREEDAKRSETPPRVEERSADPQCISAGFDEDPASGEKGETSEAGSDDGARTGRAERRGNRFVEGGGCMGGSGMRCIRERTACVCM